jgi:hypothetical protein
VRKASQRDQLYQFVTFECFFSGWFFINYQLIEDLSRYICGPVVERLSGWSTNNIFLVSEYDTEFFWNNVGIEMYKTIIIYIDLIM